MTEVGDKMIVMLALLVLAGIVSTLVVLLIKFPKPTLITLAVLIVVVPVVAITAAIGLPIIAKSRHSVHIEPRPTLVTPAAKPLIAASTSDQAAIHQWVDEVNQQVASQPVGSIDRTWVTDTAAFVNANPHRRFLIAESTPTAISEDEATRKAQELAAVLLARHLGVPVTEANRAYMHQAVFRLAADRVVQKHEKPYGHVWSASFLLDISPEKLAPVAATLTQQRMRKDQSVRWTLVASGALFAVMWLLYLGLNTITRGYYAWRLRATGIVCGIGLIMLVMLRLKMMT
jgi:hypothetical protein